MNKDVIIINIYSRLVQSMVNHQLCDFLRANRFNKIAIYGYGALGQSLHVYLNSEGFQVAYIIDMSEKVRDSIISPECYGDREKYPNTDITIITTVVHGESIQDFLYGRVDGPVFLLEDLL